MNLKTTLNNWWDIIGEEFDKTYMRRLSYLIQQRRSSSAVYPDESHTFEALRLCQPDNVKTIWVGQDPYIQEGQAHGVAFSSKIDIPPSLKSMYKHYENTVKPLDNPSGDLTSWAEQGMLLLNLRLTTDKGIPGSHKGLGWERFITQLLLNTLSVIPYKIPLILIGKEAQILKGFINYENKYCLEHPAFAARQQREWDGKNIYNIINNYLIENNIKPINYG